MRHSVGAAWAAVGLLAGGILVGCGQAEAPEIVDEAAAAPEEDLASVEIAAPPPPTHWLGDGAIGQGDGPVTDAHLKAGTSDTTKWVLYGGDYANHRHSPIDDINRDNVDNLQVAWAFPTGTPDQFEVSPTVYDGVMYVSSSYNRLFALDPATGELHWRYDHQLPDDLRLCCGSVNRGVAIAGDSVLMATLDAKILSFNRLTGEINWETTIVNYADGYSATSMPLIVKDMAIIGIAGGEFGVRGFFDAYDVNTGELRWRHYTVPVEGEPGIESWAGDSWKSGGAPAWTSGAYDVETDILYWTTGNPAPDWNGDLREGDNLFSNSILAVNPNTGERLWYFQFTPHDVWDYDGNTHIFLTDVERDGETIKAIVQPNRNGFFYILDRTDGSFVAATQYVEELNWAEIDESGRPVVNPLAKPVEEPDYRVCPSNLGGLNGAWTAAMNPDTGLVFIPSVESCQYYQKGISAFVKGTPFLGGAPITVDVNEGKAHGNVVAVDKNTGEVKWRYVDKDPMMAGALSTAGGLVFTGNQSGHAMALDSDTGEVLWQFRMGGGVRSQPVAYRAGERSYVAIGAGNFNTFATFAGGPTNIPEGGNLFVFALPE